LHPVGILFPHNIYGIYNSDRGMNQSMWPN